MVGYLALLPAVSLMCISRSQSRLCLVAVKPDPERARQETAAFRANVEAAQDNLPVHVSYAID